MDVAAESPVEQSASAFNVARNCARQSVDLRRMPSCIADIGTISLGIVLAARVQDIGPVGIRNVDSC
jgi:hypothetical protein